jgi:hypothetical protein
MHTPGPEATITAAPAESPRPPLSWPALAMFGLLCYGALVAVPAARNFDLLDGDTVAYVRLSKYLVEGRWAESVSSHWAPLLSWCMAPLLALGMDGLHACRTVLLAGGAGMVLAFTLLLGRFGPTSRLWQLVAVGLLAALAAHWAVSISHPDVIMAALLMVYFWCVLDPSLLAGRRRQFACGLLGGAACLAKAYALPFFVAHFVMTAVLRRYAPAPASRTPWRAVALAIAVGILGAALVAGPWIAVLSAKQGRLTLSTAGDVNRYAISPEDGPRGLLVSRHLWTPPPDRVSVWEHPEELAWPSWSPLDSADHAVFQLKLAARNVWEIAGYLRTYDIFCLAIILMAGAPIVMWRVRRTADGWLRVAWLPATIVLYGSGYLLMVVNTRYILPVIATLAWLYCVYLASLLHKHVARPPSAVPHRRVLGVALAAVLLASFGLPVAARLASESVHPYARPYRQLAAHLTADGYLGPIACTNYDLGLYVAFHTGQPYLGRPQHQDPAECLRELEEYGARVFLVDCDSPLWDSFDGGGAFRLATTLTDGGPDERPLGTVGGWYGGPVKVFVRCGGS